MSILSYNIFGIYIKKNLKKISGRRKLTLIFLKSLAMTDNVIKWPWPYQSPLNGELCIKI